MITPGLPESLPWIRVHIADEADSIWAPFEPKSILKAPRSAAEVTPKSSDAHQSGPLAEDSSPPVTPPDAVAPAAGQHGEAITPEMLCRMASTQNVMPEILDITRSIMESMQTKGSKQAGSAATNDTMSEGSRPDDEVTKVNSNSKKGGSFFKRMNGYSTLSRRSMIRESCRSSVPDAVELGPLRSFLSVSITTQWSFDVDYEVKLKLGQGGFGSVYLCTNRETGQDRAVKIIAAQTMKDRKRYEKELKVFERLSNPYIVQLHEVFGDKWNMYLVMDLCTGGDLLTYMAGFWLDDRYPERGQQVRKKPELALGLPWQYVMRFLWQMLAGVMYLHHHRFCHRDIKLDNFMLKEDGTEHPHLQLCDFGLSTRVEKGAMISGHVGTPTFMAPEVVNAAKYTQSCDIWSVGICGWIMITFRSPWGVTDSQEETLKRVGKGRMHRWPDTPGAPDELRELRVMVDQMTLINPPSRPTAKGLMKQNHFLQEHGPPTDHRTESQPSIVSSSSVKTLKMKYLMVRKPDCSIS